MAWPSRQVTTEAASPGMCSRIEVVEPPYCAPWRMPASRINAVSGGMPKVSGSSSAMVVTGPRPGSTPASVPTSTPRKQKPRLTGVSATPPKPSPRPPSRSCMLSGPPGAQTQRGQAAAGAPALLRQLRRLEDGSARRC
jgi:hypothetical protein